MHPWETSGSSKYELRVVNDHHRNLQSNTGEYKCSNLFVCHFSITVVQSYFVYWAGIESAVVRDGNRSPWSGSNITGVDGGNSIFAQKEDEVTALPGKQVVQC